MYATWSTEHLAECLVIAIQYSQFSTAKQIIAELTSRVSEAQFGV